MVFLNISLNIWSGILPDRKLHRGRMLRPGRICPKHDPGYFRVIFVIKDVEKDVEIDSALNC